MTPPEFAHTGGQLVIRSEKILHYNHVYDCEFETEILLLLFFSSNLQTERNFISLINNNFFIFERTRITVILTNLQ